MKNHRTPVLPIEDFFTTFEKDFTIKLGQELKEKKIRIKLPSLTTTPLKVVSYQVDTIKDKTMVRIFCDNGHQELFDLTNYNLPHLPVKEYTYRWICMSIAYKSIFPSSQHWKIPHEVYTMITTFFDTVSNFSVTECFASPFNSNALLSEESSHPYCSILPFYDAMFGSQGNFFTITNLLGDITEESNKLYIVNPPFVPHIMTMTSSKILEIIKTNEMVCVVFFPNWSDFDALEALLGSEYTLVNFILEPFKHHYVCSLSDKRIMAKFSTRVIILSSIKMDVTRLSELTDLIEKSYK